MYKRQSNAHAADERSDIPIDQVVIGSCTNGRISDMETAYRILKGRHVAKGVRAIIIPATQQVYLEALQRGYIEEFIKAGCVAVSYTHLDVYKRQVQGSRSHVTITHPLVVR